MTHYFVKRVTYIYTLHMYMPLKNVFFFFDTKQAQIFYLHNLEVSGLNILLSTVAPGAWTWAKLSPNHILKKAFATRQHAFHSTFYDISVRACAEIKILRTRQECDTHL